MTTYADKELEQRKLAIRLGNQWGDHGSYIRCYTDRMCGKCEAIFKAIKQSNRESLERILEAGPKDLPVKFTKHEVGDGYADPTSRVNHHFNSANTQWRATIQAEIEGTNE